jgi:hypothetical protein
MEQPAPQKSRGTRRAPARFHTELQQEVLMKKLALSIAAAAALLTAAVPAMAQVGFYAGPLGIGVGAPYYGPGNGYYDYYGRPGVYVGPGWHHSHHWHRR